MSHQRFRLSGLAILVLAGPVGAQSIGLNFVGGNNNATDTLTSTQTAGVVPQANWNNLTGSNSSATSGLLDSNGNPTSLSVSWVNGANNYDNSSTSNVAPNANNPDQILNNGGIWGATNRGPKPTVTVSNVPYSSYEVIVTSLLDHGGTIISTSLGSSTVYANQTQNPQDAGYIDGTSSKFTYTQSTDTTGSGTTGGDYALFTGLTGSSFTVSEDIVSGNATAANLSSIEIVNTATVPEPASLAALGVAAAGLVLRRRRA